MINSPLQTLGYNGSAIARRESDGYWNATQMCKANGKRLNNFLRSDKTKDYLDALASDLNSRELPLRDSESTAQAPYTATVARNSAAAEHTPLVQIEQGGNSQDEQGTWVHEEVALKLAAWLNPQFEVFVFRQIKTLLTKGEVKLKDALAEYDIELAQAQYQLSDALYELDRLRPVFEVESEYLEDPEEELSPWS